MKENTKSLKELTPESLNELRKNGFTGQYKGIKIKNENQANIIKVLHKKPMTRAVMRKLKVNPERSDLRYLERKGVIKKEKLVNNDGTRMYVYSLVE